MFWAKKKEEKNITIFHLKTNFYGREILQYITWACFRNVYKQDELVWFWWKPTINNILKLFCRILEHKQVTVNAALIPEIKTKKAYYRTDILHLPPPLSPAANV